MKCHLKFKRLCDYLQFFGRFLIILKMNAMKRLIIYLAIILLILPACTKLSDNKSSRFLLAGIKGSKGSEIVCVNVDSGVVVNTTPIDCYVFGSTVYDPESGGYGYVNCDSVFMLVNPETGKLIKSVKLPGFVSQSVIDIKENMLIGMYTVITYGEQPDSTGSKSGKDGPPVYTNYVIKVDLANGTIVSEKEIDIGDGAYMCTSYFNQADKGYVMMRADKTLITINPSTGAIVKEVPVGKVLTNPVYYSVNNTIIGLSYSEANERNYLEVVNAETGSVISSIIVDQEKGYIGCLSGYDPESNCYITVNSDYKVLFYDITSGEIKKTYMLDDPMNDIKFWRKE